MVRVAVGYRSDLPFERAWSGIPAGLAGGLAQSGHEPVVVSAAPPQAIARLSERRGDQTRAAVALRNASARVRVRRAGKVGASVQMGTDYGFPLPGPVATFEDMTVALAARTSDHYRRMPAATIEAWRARQAHVYAQADACCVASEWAARSVREDYGVAAQRVHVVGFGRNLDPAPAERDWGSPRFLFIGRFWERKNGPAGLEAFTRLRAELPAATLDLVGAHPRVGLDGVVEHGELSLSSAADGARVVALLERATAFVMPSNVEPFGIAYVEAGAAGVPSIGTTIGGAADAVGDGGVLVEPGDPAALLGAMRRLAEPEEARRLGAAAQANAARFTWRAVAARVAGALGIG